MDKTAEQIAARLSSGEVERLLACPTGGSRMWRGWENLHLHALIEIDGSTKSWRATRTSLGEQVKVILQEQAGER